MGGSRGDAPLRAMMVDPICVRYGKVNGNWRGYRTATHDTEGTAQPAEEGQFFLEEDGGEYGADYD